MVFHISVTDAEKLVVALKAAKMVILPDESPVQKHFRDTVTEVWVEELSRLIFQEEMKRKRK